MVDWVICTIEDPHVGDFNWSACELQRAHARQDLLGPYEIIVDVLNALAQERELLDVHRDAAVNELVPRLATADFFNVLRIFRPNSDVRQNLLSDVHLLLLSNYTFFQRLNSVIALRP